MPTLSVAAPQLRSISAELTAVAVRVPGAEGGVVSGVPLTAVVMSVWIAAAESALL